MAEERVRIAEELHDIVAHSMGVIALQAGVGAHVIDSQPGEAKQALLEISKASRETLGEIRRILGVLRGPDGTSSYRPAPGLADLDALADQVRAGGPEVVVRRTGPDLPLPTGLDLTAYRIVQEGLMNVTKHAAADHCTIRLAADDALTIDITDDGRGLPEAYAPGVGLRSMRERAAELGGACTIESNGTGTRLSVSLPIYREEGP